MSSPIGTTTSKTGTIAVHSATLPGDVLVLAYSRSSLTVPPTPAGFTHLRSVAGTSSTNTPVAMILAWRRVAAGDPTSITIEADNNGNVAAILRTLRDVDSITASANVASITRDTNTIPSLPVGRTGRLCSFFGVVTNRLSEWTGPSGMGLAITEVNLGGSTGVSLWEKAYPTAADTGTQTATYGPGATSQAVLGMAVTVLGNFAPDAPALTTMADNGVIDRAKPTRAQHVHSDRDGDGQAAFELRYRVVGTTAWTTVSQNTVNQFYDFPAAALASGDYERQVRTSDGKLWGAWSASGFFRARDVPAGPTFVAPINGETISAPTFDVEVSATTFDTLEVRALDAAGAVIVPVVSSTTGRFTGVGPVANSQTITSQARAIKDTLAGDWVSISNPVSYTLPPKPTASLTAYRINTQPVGISVRVSVPPPATGQPSAQSVAVERSEFIAGAWSAFRILRAARALSPNATHHDLTVASGLETRYRIRANAASGAFSLSDIVVSLGGVTDTSGTDPVEPNVSTTV